jgi:hypothetical protein
MLDAVRNVHNLSKIFSQLVSMQAQGDVIKTLKNSLFLLNTAVILDFMKISTPTSRILIINNIATFIIIELHLLR